MGYRKEEFEDVVGVLMVVEMTIALLSGVFTIDSGVNVGVFTFLSLNIILIFCFCLWCVLSD